MASPSENTSNKASQIQSGAPTEPGEKSPEELRETRVTSPGPGRIITGAGHAGSQLQRALRQDDPIPPWATLGQQIVSLVREWLKLR
jgi:hypothetical protein